MIAHQFFETGGHCSHAFVAGLHFLRGRTAGRVVSALVVVARKALTFQAENLRLCLYSTVISQNQESPFHRILYTKSTLLSSQNILGILSNFPKYGASQKILSCVITVFFKPLLSHSLFAQRRDEPAGVRPTDIHRGEMKNISSHAAYVTTASSVRVSPSVSTQLMTILSPTLPPLNLKEK